MICSGLRGGEREREICDNVRPVGQKKFKTVALNFALGVKFGAKKFGINLASLS